MSEILTTFNDPDNCGACGKKCPENAPYCVCGECVPTCDFPQETCGDGNRICCGDPFGGIHCALAKLHETSCSDSANETTASISSAPGSIHTHVYYRSRVTAHEDNSSHIADHHEIIHSPGSHNTNYCISLYERAYHATKNSILSHYEYDDSAVMEKIYIANNHQCPFPKNRTESIVCAKIHGINDIHKKLGLKTPKILITQYFLGQHYWFNAKRLTNCIQNIKDKNGDPITVDISNDYFIRIDYNV